MHGSKFYVFLVVSQVDENKTSPYACDWFAPSQVTPLTIKLKTGQCFLLKLVFD